MTPLVSAQDCHKVSVFVFKDNRMFIKLQVEFLNFEGKVSFGARILSPILL